MDASMATLISDKIAMTREALLLEVGQSITTGAMGRDYYKQGFAFYGKILGRVQNVVCGNERCKSLSQSAKESDTIVLVSAVADLVSSLVIGVSPVTVAVLIVRDGLPRLCNEFWNCSGEGNGRNRKPLL